MARPAAGNLRKLGLRDVQPYDIRPTGPNGNVGNSLLVYGSRFTILFPAAR